jgi:hypothetical protein
LPDAAANKRRFRPKVEIPLLGAYTAGFPRKMIMLTQYRERLRAAIHSGQNERQP